MIVTMRRVDEPLQPAKMHDALVAFLDVAKLGEITSELFLDRLETIHRRYLGAAWESEEVVASRQQALAAYRRLVDDIERHHEIELLAEALGVAP